jgi:alanyl-tRNA synthetase
MRSEDVRHTFLRFFEERGHKLYASSSLIPPPETNLLLTTAGMVQFRPYFLGLERPPQPRATSVQKSFRTTDIEEVGDQSHLTLFEMLGNFSFGDYFKKEAIAWAWELATKDFGLEPERLWVTVHEDDDESVDLWLAQTPIPAERIQRLGTPKDERGDHFNLHDEENFWTMGVAGPGGPNSEMFYDRGEQYGEPGGPAVNDTRYLEFYNLVFMQFVLDDAGEIVEPLPAPSVDTGMGLERITTILQDAISAYDTDLFEPVLERASQLTDKPRGSSEEADRLLRTLTDHSRSAAFLIGDGVTPSNEGRGYILRRLIRRAVTKARLSGVTDTLFPSLCEAVIDKFGDAYPELRLNREGIVTTALREEQRFSQTLDAGLGMLRDELERVSGVLSGEVAFKLQDTYGFPLEITRDVADDAGVRVDEDEFERLMAQQRERSRAATETGKRRIAEVGRLDVDGTDFLGYESREALAKVVGILRGLESVAAASEGEEVDIVLDRTPFYAEGGGQVGDRGVLETGDASAQVLDTQNSGSLILHRARVTSGELTVGADVEARVDPNHRVGAERAHTATHILHHTLRDKIGTHVRQMGSLVEPGRLHFDFSHFAAVPRDLMDEIEETANQRVGADDDVTYRYVRYDEAIASGALAFFEDKYGDEVRVVEVGDYSRELCGGTHVHHTGNVGFVKVLNESSIGSNIRRVEALTGLEGLRWVNKRLRAAERAAELVRAPADELVQGIERLVATQKELQKKLDQQQRAGVGDALKELVAQARSEPKGKLVVAKRTEDVGVLRELAASVRDKLGPSIVVLGAAGDGRANLVAAATKGLVDAREVLKPAAQRIGGGAGGKPELAMAGGRQAGGIDEALAVATDEAQKALA